MKLKYCFLLLIFFSSCKQTIKQQAPEKVVIVNPNGAVKRYASITGLRADKVDYYKQLHANAWPAVLKKITACNIHNYSIYLKQIDGKYFLFSYFEYTGNDFDADMKKMAADTTTQKWWKETDPCQLPLPEAAAKNKIWADMEEVFHEE